MADNASKSNAGGGTKNLPMNHPGGTNKLTHHFVGKSIEPKVIPVKLRKLMEMYDVIHIDSELLQRIFSLWSDKKIDEFIVAFLDGTGRINPLVMAHVNKVIGGLKELVAEGGYDEDTEKNLNDSIEFFEDIQSQGKTFILLDGQHRIKHLVRWIRPESPEDLYIPSNVDLNTFWADSNGNPDKIAGTAFADLPLDVQDGIYDKTIPVVFILNGDLKTIQKVFKVVNLGEALERMEMRMISLDPVAGWIREIVDPTETITIARFLRNVLKPETAKDKRISKKGDAKMVALCIGFAERLKYPGYWKDDKLDEIVNYTTKVTKTKRNRVEKTLETIALGFINKYTIRGIDEDVIDKKTKKVKTPKDVQIKLSDKKTNWASVFNTFIFTYLLENGELPYLKNNKIKGITVNNHIKYVEFIEKMLNDLRVKETYMYLDDNGKITPKVHLDENNNPRFALDGEGNKFENEHGFPRKDSIMNEKNITYKIAAMNEYFSNKFDDLKVTGVIIPLVGTRGLTSKKKVEQAVWQDWTDDYTGNEMSLEEILSGDKTAAVHNKTPYSKGGESKTVANSKINKSLGIKEIPMVHE